MNNFFNLGFFLLSLATVSSAIECPSNTAEWCLNTEIAKACNVLNQCEQFIWSSRKVADADLVNFTLYYESLCPDCRDFMRGELWKAFSSVSSIMNLTVIPYGNAKETWRNETKLWQFTCQHGPDECWGNLFHSCLIYYYPGADKHLPTIHCMESDDSDDIRTASVKCAKQLNIQIDTVNKCMTSRLGNNLQHANAVLTDALNPKHQYVPWVTLNGVHTEDIQSKAQTDLVKLICDTYQGTKPDACNK